MKLLLKLLLLVATVAYLVYAFFHVNAEKSNSVCQNVTIEITDSVRVGFITRQEVQRILERSKLYPLGKKVAEVNGQQIEDRLMKNPFISKVVCYKSGTQIYITVQQRLPVMRVMASNGDDYFLDSAGKVLPRLNYAADLVVATGNITPDYAKKYLVRIGSHLQRDPFWNDQIEQINVDSRGNVEMVPRVGNQIIYVGKPVNMFQKFKHLRAFYNKVAGEVGWNKYSRINVEYANQIICTKKQE